MGFTQEHTESAAELGEEPRSPGSQSSALTRPQSFHLGRQIIAASGWWERVQCPASLDPGPAWRGERPVPGAPMGALCQMQPDSSPACNKAPPWAHKQKAGK